MQFACLSSWTLTTNVKNIMHHFPRWLNEVASWLDVHLYPYQYRDIINKYAYGSFVSFSLMSPSFSLSFIPYFLFYTMLLQYGIEVRVLLLTCFQF